ncbi:DNA mismatch repair protein MutS [Capnocytophaga genosp. AHN8471]|uniref:DNA mismatch repair protein MutS n=1 Tax=Capnocytophaga genosp. AHN8471 TaxID=327574 RepID=A0ABS1YW23_9FLAO|nr:DNA mismatch repair protein MutS [Capnocytophaga genosp. AHN8471]MBM0650614.1 DNA mismatch repair protein MutS [Capnocytophaga genosp. AHN8471]MBM0661802.1 DNA mismatch repair protein MutS [Capnocytophaga genosp. AHN8471]
MNTKTLEDLEFPTVLSHLSDLCLTELGKKYALRIKPFDNQETLLLALNQTNEYLSSFDNNNTIPSHYCESITSEIKLLSIENALLEVSSIRKIHRISEVVNTQILFFKKFKTLYPTLFETADSIEYTTELLNAIDKVLDKYGEIKNEASPTLGNIRRELSALKGKLNESFNRALAEYNTADYLDDIRETVVENRRVLAVKAMYRRKVQGTVWGSSKTGSIVYIEPRQTEIYSRELSNLLYDEKEEIQRILRELTAFISQFADLLKDYQRYITAVDIICAKAKYAHQMNALLPEITQERELFLREAYHPLLYLSNAKKGVTTFPQTIELNDENRIIVISGPNAGGKSITLKTIGLLQLMLQSGMLVPVHHRSKMCLFERILTDIGDNQSIENHLSTYSYRLKNMNYFLKKCNHRTLFLIDEFGTGSDPELGGALAEIFLEEFYHRKAFGVITTHYTNLKMLADELPHTSNANMLFNDKTLEPIYKLIIGEAGSSFTFEVAQKNGIPFSLINRAKKKIEKGKVRFDATIAKLQKERSKMEKTAETLKDEETKAREEAKRLEELNDKIKSKLVNYQELYDQSQRMITLGSKVDQIAERYFYDGKRRPLVSEFLKLIEMENAKRKQMSKEERTKQKEEKKTTTEEVHKQMEAIRQQRKEEKKERIAQERAEKEKLQRVLSVGDRVRIKDSRSVGSIDKIEKGKAIVNYGAFTTSVSLDELELVQKIR